MQEIGMRDEAEGCFQKAQEIDSKNKALDKKMTEALKIDGIRASSIGKGVDGKLTE